MTIQPSLFPDAEAPAPAGAAPPGFRYREELVAPEREAALVAAIAGLTLKPFEFHGHLGLRRVKSFGWRYDYERRRIDPVEPIPDLLLSLREAAAAFAGRPAEDFVQALVTEYAPGAPIGWHRDKPQYGEVVGVSLLSPCVLRLRRREGEKWVRASQHLAPRSAYVLAGEARRDWEHSIAPMAALRYSVTFRTLARAERPQA